MNEDHKWSPGGTQHDALHPSAIEVRALSVAFGGLRALTDVTASVNADHIVAVIGPNGAGKTTLLNAICGLVPKANGEVRHYGKDVTNAHPTKIAQRRRGAQLPGSAADRFAQRRWRTSCAARTRQSGTRWRTR